ncbi:hypothetical protein DXG01_004932 [Tephrocybe rancida]|nr:hypothetical protein DXG01_004932 [Tephrocybe rancida]
MPAMIYRSEPPIPTDIIIYKMGDKFVYMRPADDYEQALDYAQKEFPDELRGVTRDRIELYTIGKVDGQRQLVRISADAWTPTAARLMRGEIVFISIKPLPSTTKDGEVAPPQYLEIPPLHFTSSTPPSPKRTPSPLPTARRSRSWFGRR